MKHVTHGPDLLETTQKAYTLARNVQTTQPETRQNIN